MCSVCKWFVYMISFVVVVWDDSRLFPPLFLLCFLGFQCVFLFFVLSLPIIVHFMFVDCFFIGNVAKVVVTSTHVIEGYCFVMSFGWVLACVAVVCQVWVCHFCMHDAMVAAVP